MRPKDLFKKLMDLYGDNPNSLAEKLKHEGVRQPQLYKFQEGITVNPRWSTLEPVARYYRIPAEAFFSAELAAQIAEKLDSGWLPKPMWRSPNQTHPTPIAAEQTPPPHQPAAQASTSIEDAFETLAMRLIALDQTLRKQAAFQLSSLADSPMDHKKLAALFTMTTEPSKQRRA